MKTIYEKVKNDPLVLEELKVHFKIIELTVKRIAYLLGEQITSENSSLLSHVYNWAIRNGKSISNRMNTQGK